MLRSLYIRDFALIEELEMEFEGGLNIITGETGAGKSILVGGLKMILGERASTETVRSGAKKAVIEGLFDDVDAEALAPVYAEHEIEPSASLLLRREITGSQSRAFINDSPVTVQAMRAVADHLVDLHGQHEHQSLLRTETHVDLLDGFSGLGGLRSNYAARREEVAVLIRERAELAARERDLAQQKDLYGFQIEEIDRVAPRTGEEDELDAEVRVLENAERLHESTAALFENLYEAESAVYDRLTVALYDLQELARIDSTFDDALAEIRSTQITVSDVAKFLQDYNARIEFNPERLDTLRERLGALERLKRRYGGTLDSVIAHRDDIGARHAIAANFAGALRRLDERLAVSRRQLWEAAERLSAKRRESAERIEIAIALELGSLGMPAARFEVEFDNEEDPEGWIDSGEGPRLTAFAQGMDRINFLISANPGEAPRPLSRIASGGEISRIMLALKTILARGDRLPTLVFDEIDVGVSGAIAQRVGERMHDLARHHQIITITHLPQVAAVGDVHFRVEKTVNAGRTRTGIVRLDDDQRAAEIASLISGSTVTEASLQSARELMTSTR